MIHGADASTVREALETGDPLPGTTGFAGSLDGILVRDVLGREPLFVDEEHPDRWSVDPGDLDAPVSFPAGHAGTGGEAERVWTLPDPDPVLDRREAVKRVRSAVSDAIDAVDVESLAVAFSGGVDSAALAARLDAPLYVVGFPNSDDVAAAKRAAGLLDREVRVRELTLADVEAAVPEVARAIRRTNAMDVQIALPLYFVARRAAADGFDRLAVGQGADELFGGYAKVARAPDDPRVEADTVAGARREVTATLPDQLERDVLGIRAAGMEPVAPLLADGVVRAALELPGEMLVTDRGERKWAFRLAVREWVPDPVAFRDKKAVQYGSDVSRELDRIARQAGYKRRQDDHVTAYVESRLE